jgi:hypothetical protein
MSGDEGLENSCRVCTIVANIAVLLVKKVQGRRCFQMRNRTPWTENRLFHFLVSLVDAPQGGNRIRFGQDRTRQRRGNIDSGKDILSPAS